MHRGIRLIPNNSERQVTLGYFSQGIHLAITRMVTPNRPEGGSFTPLIWLIRVDREMGIDGSLDD